MRTQNYKSKLASLVMVLVLTSTLLNAQNYETDYAFEESVIGNIRMGIQSDNPGLKKSSVYFAGKYAVKEVVETLMNELEDADDVQMKYLISVALYKIGNAEGMSKVRELATSDKSLKLRRLASAIFNQYDLERISRVAGN